MISKPFANFSFLSDKKKSFRLKTFHIFFFKPIHHLYILKKIKFYDLTVETRKNTRMIDFNSISYSKKVTFLFHYFTIISSIIGLFFNLITFIIFSRKKFRKHSFAFYMRFKMLTDCYFLLQPFRFFFAFMFENLNLSTSSNSLCKATEYFSYMSVSLSMWILALIGFDRLLTIVYPTRFRFVTHFFTRSNDASPKISSHFNSTQFSIFLTSFW